MHDTYIFEIQSNRDLSDLNNHYTLSITVQRLQYVLGNILTALKSIITATPNGKCILENCSTFKIKSYETKLSLRPFKPSGRRNGNKKMEPNFKKNATTKPLSVLARTLAVYMLCGRVIQRNFPITCDKFKLYFDCYFFTSSILSCVFFWCAFVACSSKIIFNSFSIGSIPLSISLTDFQVSAFCVLGCFPSCFHTFHVVASKKKKIT